MNSSQVCVAEPLPFFYIGLLHYRPACFFIKKRELEFAGMLVIGDFALAAKPDL